MITNLIYSARKLSALAVLSLGIIVSFVVFHFTLSTIEYHKKIFLEKEVENFVKLIELRISAYETILHSLRAVYVSHENNDFQPFKSVDQFDQYVSAIRFPEKTPSLKTIVFYRKVWQKDKISFQNKMRDQFSEDHLVYKNYKIFPDSKKPFVLAVEMVSPFASNFKALGYDVFHEKVRSDALHHAFYSDFSISDKITLVHTGEDCVLLFAPVYNKIYSRKDLININNLEGVIGSAFSLNEFFEEVLKSSIFGSDALIKVSDINENKSNLLYQHPNFVNKLQEQHYIHANGIKIFGGRHWKVEFLVDSNSKSIFGNIYEFIPKITLSFCLVITLIVFILHIRNHQLYESESRFKRIMDVAPLAIAITDLETSRIVLFNQKASELFQYDLLNINNYDPANFYCNIEQRHKLMQELNEHGKFNHHEIYFRRADNSKFWALCAGTLTHFEAKKVLLISFVDITLRKELEAKLIELATTDSLTGIFNRRHFLESGRQEILRASEYQHDLSVIMLDIDHFKRVNDTYGHDSGDVVIRKVVEITASFLKDFDVFGRLGGEEFAIVLPECSQSSAEDLANNIRLAIEKHIFDFPQCDAYNIRITISLGLVAIPACQLIDQSSEFPTIEKLLTKADEALYDAKHNGRNQVQIRQF